MSINYYGTLFQGAKITPAVKRATERTAAYAKGLVKGKSPVKTGLLKRSWDIKPFGYGLAITNPVSYTIYQEMGTKHIAAKKMVVSSIPEVRKRFRQELRIALAGDDKRAKKIIGSVAGSEVASSYEALTQGGKPDLGNVGFK